MVKVEGYNNGDVGVTFDTAQIGFYSEHGMMELLVEMDGETALDLASQLLHVLAPANIRRAVMELQLRDHAVAGTNSP